MDELTKHPVLRHHPSLRNFLDSNNFCNSHLGELWIPFFFFFFFFLHILLLYPTFFLDNEVRNEESVFGRNTFYLMFSQSPFTSSAVKTE